MSSIDFARFSSIMPCTLLTNPDVLNEHYYTAGLYISLVLVESAMRSFDIKNTLIIIGPEFFSIDFESVLYHH
ncbi:hypothetical protein ACTXT7_002851 [Hymenolepis weldensis]